MFQRENYRNCKPGDSWYYLLLFLAWSLSIISQLGYHGYGPFSGIAEFSGVPYGMCHGPSTLEMKKPSLNRLKRNEIQTPCK